MKEKEAKNYSKRVWKDGRSFSTVEKYSEIDFLAGWDARDKLDQWIPANKLPETSDKMLVKWDDGKECFYGIAYYNHVDKKWEDFSPSHWKPIN